MWKETGYKLDFFQGQYGCCKWKAGWGKNIYNNLERVFMILLWSFKLNETAWFSAYILV